PPLDGLSEVAGIGVLERARRRGIGGAMTAAAARDAAARGAELVFLAPGSGDAQSVYERGGFGPAESSLCYADPEGCRFRARRSSSGCNPTEKEVPMQYVLLIYGDEARWNGRSEDEQQAMYAEYGALSKDLRDRGQYVGGDELAAVTTATTV